MKISLHEYKVWRQKLTPLKIDIIIQWKVPYVEENLSNSIKEGQYFKITQCRDPIIGRKEIDADLVYDLIACSKNGVLNLNTK